MTTSDSFILVWQKGRVHVLSDGIMLNGVNKPELSFSYDDLICESPTGNYFRMLNEQLTPLTDEQIEECFHFCQSFPEQGDYHVFAYAPEEDNLCQGIMLKSEASAKGLNWTLVELPADGRACKWDAGQGVWIPLVAALTGDGGLIMDPSVNVCPSCVQYLTQEEYDALPKREHETDSWDFVKECWADKRDITQLKKDVLLELRNLYEGVRWKAMSAFVPQYEQDTWRVQLEEARAWQADSSVETPYMDAFLSFRTDEDVPSKAELAADIIANNTRYVQTMAQVNAEQWGWMKQLEKAQTGYEVDAVQASFQARTRYVFRAGWKAVSA